MKYIITLLILLLLTIQIHSEACQGGQWSAWISRDTPSATGDFEDLKNILKEKPTLNCANPTDMQVRTVGTHIAAKNTGQIFSNNQLPYGFSCENSQQINGTCLNYEIRFCCPVCPGNAWTSWVSRDLPSGQGDAEGLKDLLLEKKISCNYPTIVEARVKSTKLTAYATGQSFAIYNAQQGFYCANAQQPSGTSCYDYEVRFCCPTCDGVWSQWLDRDDPGGAGDYEDLTNLLKEKANFTCDAPILVRARTKSTQVNAFATGQKIHISPLYGFACVNGEQTGTQKCLDYEVSFCCASCSKGKWSQWFDRDDPNGNGDYEDYSNLVKENPTWKCPNPLYIAARTVGTHVNSIQTGEKITQYIPYGFNCINNDQSDKICLDYEVRFCCPKWFWYQATLPGNNILDNWCNNQCGNGKYANKCFCKNGPLPTTPSASVLCYFGYK